MNQEIILNKGCKTTRLAWLWMLLSSEPLLALYTTLTFILRKELGASPLQIAIFVALNPVLSVFAFYWGAQLSVHKHKLLPNLMTAWLFARIPFLLFPFIKNVWLFLIASAVYQIFNRASTPALMEIVKRNIPKKERARTFSFFYSLSVLEGVVLGLFVAFFLNMHENNWPLFFFIAALIGLSSLLIQMRIPLSTEQPLSPSIEHIQPLKTCISLLRTRPDFAHFQWCFMLGGLALMIIHPARALFAADILSLSLQTVTLAHCVFIGMGIALSALFWGKRLETHGIEKTTYHILILFALFPLTLLLSHVHVTFYFLAHLLYGIAQGGSHLAWHLSGTVFSKQSNSTLYTTINVLMVGVRGLIGPFLGSLFCSMMGPTAVFIAVSSLAFFGTWWLACNKQSKLPAYD